MSTRDLIIVEDLKKSNCQKTLRQIKTDMKVDSSYIRRRLERLCKEGILKKSVIETPVKNQRQGVKKQCVVYSAE